MDDTGSDNQPAWSLVNGRVVSANEARMSNFYYRFVGYKRLRI